MSNVADFRSRFRLNTVTKESRLLFAFFWYSAADRLINRPLAALVRAAEYAEGDYFFLIGR